MFLNLLISRNVPRDPGSQDPSFLRVCSDLDDEDGDGGQFQIEPGGLVQDA